MTGFFIDNDVQQQYVGQLQQQIQRMTQYLRYLSIEELKDQINSRFSTAKIKMHDMNATHQSVDDRFSNYISQIKSKQMQYQSILKQQTDLAPLLRKRRNKINQSLQRYERNKRCKTISGFKSMYSEIQQSTPLKVMQEVNAQIAKPYLYHHSLLEKQKINTHCKTQVGFFQPKQEKENCKSEASVPVNRTKTKPLSVTSVMNIVVNQKINSQSFTFAKESIKAQIPENNVNKTKKAIRFQTAPMQSIRSNSKHKISHESNQKNPNLKKKCIKKIKDRIQNSLGVDRLPKNKRKTNQLLLVYEQQLLARMQMKRIVASSGQVYFKILNNHSNIPRDKQRPRQNLINAIKPHHIIK